MFSSKGEYLFAASISDSIDTGVTSLRASIPFVVKIFNRVELYPLRNVIFFVSVVEGNPCVF